MGDEYTIVEENYTPLFYNTQAKYFLEETIMKKFISLALVLMLTLILAACGSDTTPSGGNTNLPTNNTPSESSENNSTPPLTSNLTSEEVANSIIIETGTMGNLTILDGITMPDKHILITSAIHGDLGFDFSFEITAEQIRAAEFDLGSVKLFYVSNDKNISEVANAISTNNDGSITVTINRFSKYVLAQTAPIYFPDGFNTYSYELWGVIIVYEGYWKNGLPNGEGTLTIPFADQTRIITGNLVDGLFNGEITNTLIVSNHTSVSRFNVEMGFHDTITVQDDGGYPATFEANVLGVYPWVLYVNMSDTAQSGNNDTTSNGGDNNNTTSQSGAYTITFIGNGGLVNDGTGSAGTETLTVKIAPGDPVPFPSAIKSGSEFHGWFIDQALSTRWDASVPITSDLTIYAKWG
jgi:hypothetical protein